MRIPVQLPDDLTQLLGLSRFECDGFLKQHRAYDHAYDLEDFEPDRHALRQLQSEGADFIVVPATPHCVESALPFSAKWRA
jgi:hypothetical protein